MFTDFKRSVEQDLQESRGYVVSPHARVRKEEFGLLFYNSQNATLTFVKSGDLLKIESLPKGQKMIAAADEETGRRKFRKILDRLVDKGLIFET